MDASEARRLIGLAGAIAAIATTLSVGTVAAAGPATVGHVYVNNNSTGHNTIAAFDRHADGSLTPIAGSPFNAGGAGTGAPYGSAGGLQRSTDGRYLLATDPASNQISVLRIKPNGGLQLVRRRRIARHEPGEHRGPRQPRLRRQRRRRRQQLHRLPAQRRRSPQPHPADRRSPCRTTRSRVTS